MMRGFAPADVGSGNGERSNEGHGDAAKVVVRRDDEEGD
jgi:hypothetical protein